MLEKITLNGISKKVIMHLRDYNEINANFRIDNSQKDTLLSIMQDILATIGEEYTRRS
jgi:hypothetical protein